MKAAQVECRVTPNHLTAWLAARKSEPKSNSPYSAF